ncbi:hypothetical protein KIN20_026948 [Parelaphostrongylus tenuis]|uniref:Uncharacterized protein n=1 Tax=Parelaphostrongylus tenuis TaxID=148309 RepID=A0AAD5QYQ2_PARTN|nr:hypothetical protein KIN20_026948 [Parelaphostrongylus tenuis]
MALIECQMRLEERQSAHAPRNEEILGRESGSGSFSTNVEIDMNLSPGANKAAISAKLLRGLHFAFVSCCSRGR